MPVGYGSTPVYCYPRLNGTGMSHARLEKIESSLVPGMPVGFHSYARVLLSSSPTTMSHGRGDLSHPVFWGNHLPWFHTAVSNGRVTLRVGNTALSTVVVPAVRCWEPVLQILC
ncbi:hypothetical protein GOBAR_AA36711 [Gossypium barbadense]|uniref:Uncharacterized protein n=1 Tax=Gossypium barbadense TaxID=3634 RepID=A0A2P5VYU3_GOSBA|nr:hypothetical protein GOBAR_AA36711 [Gossypium barbadense]